MQIVFVADSVAVVVRHWYEIGPDDNEHGARIEIRRVSRPTHVGSESAAQPLTLDFPLWRADIFDALDQPPGNLARAHFHPAFHGVEPVARHWDQELAHDWRSWLARQLADLPAVLASAPLTIHPGRDGAKIAARIPMILDAAATMLGEGCDGGAQCLAATTDTQGAVRLMLDQFRRPGALDPRQAATTTP